MPPDAVTVYLGADLGGTNFRAGLRRPGEETLLAVECVPSSGTWSAGEILDQLARMTDRLLARCPGPPPRVCGLGVGLTGDIDFREGVCYSMKRFPGLEAYPLASALAERFQVPAAIMNDGLTATLAELRAGAGRGCGDLVMITLGTGIGGGIVLDGRLVTGARGRVGKVGHQIVGTVPGPVHCHCGLNGCWQSLAGRDGIAARARDHARQCPGSALARLGPALDATTFDFRAIVAAAEAGDEASRAVITETGRWVGTGIANLVKILAPERVLVGGGTAQDNPLLFQAIQTTVGAFAIKGYQRVPVVPAHFRKDAGVLGATFLVEEWGEC